MPRVSKAAGTKRARAPVSHIFQGSGRQNLYWARGGQECETHNSIVRVPEKNPGGPHSFSQRSSRDEHAVGAIVRRGAALPQGTRAEQE